MLPYARLAPGPGFEAQSAALYYAQRLVGLSAARRAISAVLAARLRRIHGAGKPKLDTGEAHVLDRLRKDGVARLGSLIPVAVIDRMAAYFRQRPVVVPDGRRLRLEKLPAGTAAADYDLPTLLRCPGLLALVNAPKVLRLAEAYLGCKPTLSSVGVRWTFPAQADPLRFQAFHRDVDDWRFLKLFIYLTDVDLGCGPHTYVRGSHRRSFGPRARAYEPSALERAYGPDKLWTITGRRGASFMADTVGVHRGGSPVSAPRLILQAQYSILPVYAFRYDPIPAGEHALDPYCNRLLLRPGQRLAATG